MGLLRRATLASAPCVFSLASAAVAMAQSRITVQLYDRAGLRRAAREAMKAETSRIFLAAGVEVEWIECHGKDQEFHAADCSLPAAAGRFVLELKAAGRAPRTALGMNAGSYACVYPDRVVELAERAKWEFPDLLGHAAAHEIGHLTLASAAHRPSGIMRTNWSAEDLRRLTHAGLVFVPGELRKRR